MSDVVLFARSAMLIDCEGCLSITSHKYKGEYRYHTASVIIGLNQPHIDPLVMVYNRWGGKLYHTEPFSILRINGINALRLVADIRPYMMVKTQEADVLLQFKLGVNTRHNEALKERLHTLNTSVWSERSGRKKGDDWVGRVALAHETNAGIP